MAQKMIEQNRPAPVQRKNTVKNPLAGLVICGKCGRRMVRRPYTSGHSDTLMCAATSCDNVSASLPCVESRILGALREWLGEYKLAWDKQLTPISDGTKAQENAVRALDAKLTKLEKQLLKVHELLEQGEYDVPTYRERAQSVKMQMEQVKSERAALEQEYMLSAVRAETQRSLVPKVERLLEVYENLPTPKAKNDLLKEVLEKIVYTKEQGGRWNSEPDNFELILYPKLPEYE